LVLCTVKVLTAGIYDFDHSKEQVDVKSFGKELVDVVVTMKLETKGIAPMPRSDHSCILIKKNT